MRLLLFICLWCWSMVSFSQLRYTIHFDFDKYSLTSGEKQKLDSFLSGVPKDSIEQVKLSGHCDSIGSNAYNDELSRHRAKTISDYLISRKIPAALIKPIQAFGKRQPLVENVSEKSRTMNRRVEVFISMKGKPAEKTLTERVTDTTTKEGDNIIVKNLNFIGGRHVLLPQSVPVLQELLQVMKTHPSLEIEIQGHICCTIGQEDGIDLDTYTPDLSVNRAEAVYQYLVHNGIDKKRLSYKGFGHQFPLVYPEDTEEKRTTNRRVEIKIMRK
jgi:outer membrane protein OmpA-like peptidoglycan-associated protein